MITRSGVLALVILGHLCAFAVGRLGAPEFALTSAAFLGLTGVLLLTSLGSASKTTTDIGSGPSDGPGGAFSEQ